MRTTKAERDRRRVERWLSANQGLWLSHDAGGLLEQRLAIRARALRWEFPMLLGQLLWLLLLSAQGSGGRPAVLLGFVVWPTVLVAVVEAWVSHRERQLSKALKVRVSRAEALGYRTVLGPWRLAWLTLAIVSQGLVAVGALICNPPRGWLTLAAWAFSSAVAAVLVRDASRRPTMALDESSLAADERLRSQSAWTLTTPLWMLSLVIMPSVSYVGVPSGLELAALVAVICSFGLRSVAELQTPWKTGPTGPAGELPRRLLSRIRSARVRAQP